MVREYMTMRSISDARFLLRDMGSCLLSDGNKGYASVAAQSSNDFIKLNSYTWMTWVMFKTNQTANVLMRKGADDTSGIQLHVQTTGSPHRIELMERKLYTDERYPYHFRMGVWYHIAVTYNGTTQAVSMYVNGVLLTGRLSALTWANVVDDTTSELRLMGNGNTNESLNGWQDETVQINSVLTQSQVQDAYFKGITSTTSWYYKNDENTGTTIADSSGNNGTLTLQANGAVAPTWATNKPSFSTARTAVANRFLLRDMGTCLKFAADADFVDLGNNYGLAFDGALSISMWVRKDSTSANALVRKQKATSGYDGWGWNYDSNKIKFDFITTLNTNDFLVSTTSTSLLPLGKWVHLGLVYNNRSAKVYVNGVNQTLSIDRNTLTSGTPGSAYNCNIGNRQNSAGSNQHWIGLIDDVRLFQNIELTEAQFQNIYWRGINPQTPNGWYKLDEASGTSATDSGSNAITGTITGATYLDSPPPFGTLRSAV